MLIFVKVNIFWMKNRVMWRYLGTGIKCRKDMIYLSKISFVRKLLSMNLLCVLILKPSFMIHKIEFIF